MKEEMIVCRVCSLPTPINRDRCIHCKSPLQKSIFENNVREITLIISIWYVIMWIIYALTKAPEIKTILLLNKIEILSLLIIDILFLDRSLHHFKSIKRILYHRIHKWSPYMFYKLFVIRK